MSAPSQNGRKADAGPSSDLILEARGIVKELGEGAGRVRALNGVDISLHAGELTLLMGPSGSGKTTLLSIMGCILAPTEGHLSIVGQSTDAMDPESLAHLRRRHIGFVFQSYNLFPTLSALENVRLALDVRGIRGRAGTEEATSALEAVGLGHRLRNYPRNLSGGEQQRVAIARALAGSPALLLADEPTAALDTENGQNVMALLADLARDSSRAILAVTHDNRTLPYADRIIHIVDGLIVSEERQTPMSRTSAPARSKEKA